MNRRTLLLTAPLMIACGIGCDTALAPVPSGSEEVEAKIKVALKLTEVKLVKQPDGKFSGTGTAANGTKFNITATQGKNELSYEAVSEDGSSRMSGDQTWSGPAKP